jgi:lysine biosynthesis protein LysW
MANAFCPECDTKINVGVQPQKGQLVSCPGCGAYLEIVELSPIELDWAEVDDDFEDDEEDYDDDDDDLDDDDY